MPSEKDLQNRLLRLEGRGYPAYKDLKGSYEFKSFRLLIDHVQSDPFAAPSRFRVQVSLSRAGFPETTHNNRIRAIALRDYLARVFSARCENIKQHLGSGKSGLLAMDKPGQEILERSSVVVTNQHIEARFMVGLPARGRRILGREAATLLGDLLPRVVEQSLLHDKLDKPALQRHLDTAEDTDSLRRSLLEKKLVAFVADGACLPRRSGVDDRPLSGPALKLFSSPQSLRHTMTLPHAGEITGMGIPEGVTLIVGGGFHGKSTLLQALERGVYNHVPGDGREGVVCHPSAFKIRAEEGRRVEGVNLTPFINDLPGNTDESFFCSENASGSTSQAANIMESLEMGAQVLLLDEDTCATNLLIRDARMQELVERSGEPITPLVDRVRPLAQHGINTILVLGGCGDYFEVADTVIRMETFQPVDVTRQALEIAERHPTGRQTESKSAWPEKVPQRVADPRSLDPSKGHREVNIKARALRTVQFGKEEIDVNLLAQLVDEGQLRAIGQALDWMRRHWMKEPEATLNQVMDHLMSRLHQEGLDILDDRHRGDYVEFRPFELGAALNRLRSLRIRR